MKRKKSFHSIGMLLLLLVLMSMVACSNEPDITNLATVYPNQTVHEKQTKVDHGDVSEITQFYQSPMLDSQDLPPVRQRLPDEPKLTNEMPTSELHYTIGKYGGTLKTVTSVVDWDADVFVMDNEPLLNTPGYLGKEITGNILKGYDVSHNNKTFTFYMRKGLKWSDGYPVTMKDVSFAVNDVLFNKELTPDFPAWLKTGNDSSGKPMMFKVIDPYTFQISFDKPYPGFPIQMSAVGWRGYTDLLKPYHYLKEYHQKYASPKQLKAELKAANMDSWVKLFGVKDILNNELNHREAKGFPVLYPWEISKSTDTFTEYVRNPYYFKVDAAGNQLPYIDKIHSTYVQDMEMVNLNIISGKVDFARESASLAKTAMYKKGAENTETKVLISKMATVPTTLFLNLTYKDPTWREVVRNQKFREALSLAIPTDEIIDSVYYGLAEPSPLMDNQYNIKKANKLLDEIGMKKGPDGWRRAPDGSHFSFTYEIQPASPDFVPMSEIIVQEWRDLGIDVTMKTIDGALWGQRKAANQLQASMMWTPLNRWYTGEWDNGNWDPLWDKWETSNGKEGEEPPEDVKSLYHLINQLYLVPPEQARTEVYQQIRDEVKKHIWFFSPLMNVKQPVIVNENLGNLTEKGYSTALNCSGEQFYYKK